MTGLEPLLLAAGASAGVASTVGTVASVASIGLTAASAFASLSAGEQKASGLELQARQAGLNARAERLEGRRQALTIQDQLDRDLASQNALFAARGQLQGEGSAEAAREAAQENATKDIDLARFNTDMNALNAEQRAANARSDASAAKSKGIFDAISTVSSLKIPSVPSGVEDFGRTKTGKVPIPKRKPSLAG
jgi:hypothetical protein